MFELTDDKLRELGALNTTREISNQPRLWRETFDLYAGQKDKIAEFLSALDSTKSKALEGKRVRVVFTGAGSSEYIGATVTPFLNATGDRERFTFESVATTDIVASPDLYLYENEPTILVSFARSGNSPESIATVDIANSRVKNIRHILITCAADGELAVKYGNADNALLLLQPADSNDKGFAMTGSFTCMMLTALLAFSTVRDDNLHELQRAVNAVADLGESVINRESIIAALPENVERIVYVGSGGFKGIAREAQLKVLELTAGKIATVWDSSMGFRHGPKSFINSKTLVIGFVSSNNYTRQYDIDLLNEVATDKIAQKVIAVTADKLPADFTADAFEFQHAESVADAFLALPYIAFGQVVALNASIGVGNTPDTPSKSGTVNRVVQGVVIHNE
ncbi:MAG: SIS domain-containing protein [Bifidobacteriaceae bacterium]|nr:SIS domain-containing protein [Bifidobacteriaceae bacterium]